MKIYNTFARADSISGADVAPPPAKLVEPSPPTQEWAVNNSIAVISASSILHVKSVYILAPMGIYDIFSK